MQAVSLFTMQTTCLPRISHLNDGASILRDNDERPRLFLLISQKCRTTQQGGRKRKLPRGRLELRHWLCLEQLSALPGRPPGPDLGLLPASAIGRNSSSRIHLPVKLGKEHKSDPGPQIWRAG